MEAGGGECESLWVWEVLGILGPSLLEKHAIIHPFSHTQDHTVESSNGEGGYILYSCFQILVLHYKQQQVTSWLTVRLFTLSPRCKEMSGLFSQHRGIHSAITGPAAPRGQTWNGCGSSRNERNVAPDIWYFSIQHGKQARRSPGVSWSLEQCLALNHSSDPVGGLSGCMISSTQDILTEHLVWPRHCECSTKRDRQKKKIPDPVVWQ